MDIELSGEEFTLLQRILERYRSELSEEISGTENYQWRQELHADQDRLVGLLGKLERTKAAGDGPSELVIVVRGFVTG